MKRQLLLNTLALTACLLCTFFVASAYGFQNGAIHYTITSDTTVKVDLMFPDGHVLDNASLNCFYYDFNFIIPSHVTYNDIEYTVTEIGDSVINDYEFTSAETGNYICSPFHIIIPETVTSIGYNAFICQQVDLMNVTCLGKTPPLMNDSFICPGNVNLFVPAEAYSLYQEFNNQHNYFSSIYITDGERSTPPIYNEEFLYQPVYANGAYGCAVKIYTSANSVVYTREITCITRPMMNAVITESWVKFESRDSIYFYYEVNNDGGNYPDSWMVEFLVIDNGKSPSILRSAGSLDYNMFDYKWGESFDFIDQGIGFTILDNNEVAVTKCGYGSLWYDDIYINYSGDVVIPSTATYHNYSNDSYTTYLVSSIGGSAFSDCSSLNRVILPATIEFINYDTFLNCPNITEITCLGIEPPSTEDVGFSEENYQNVVLRVPLSAINAYRNAPVWSSFQNIEGFSDYDFEQDGLYYKKTGEGTVVITAGPDPYSGSVIVTTEVTHEGVTYTVTDIADGAFAYAELSFIIIPVTIGSIGENTFIGSQAQSVYITGEGEWLGGALPGGVKTLYISRGVTGVKGMNVNPETIYSYATTPPVCDENSFTGYDGELHVPASSLAAYFTAPYWCNFTNIIGDAVPLTGLTLNKDSVEVLVGNQLTLTAAIAPANATPATITWHSSDTTVATVDGGVITAIKAGECYIVASCQDQRAICHVLVTEIMPTEVTLDQTSAKLEVGSQLTLTATVLPEDATDKMVTWSTSNSAIATADDQGTVTAVGPGVCDITATCRDMQATCHVIVVEHLIYISLDQHEASVLPNHIITLTPTITPVSTDLVITSTNPDVAAARLAGSKIQVVGIKEGTTTILVNSSDGYAEPDSCLVTVYTERGDVNNDGFVDISDVTALIDYLLGIDNEISTINGDGDGDGDVNINDVTLLIDYLLGIGELAPKDLSSEEFTVNGVTFKMVRVDGGTFAMGCTVEQDADAEAHEAPVHNVTLSNYYIGETEVTQELWLAVMGENPSTFNDNNQCPVERVTWEMCQEFITQLNALTGRTFRLPTEAEWEFAARGGNKSQGYHFAGSDNLDEVAWFTENSGAATHPVGGKKANELGLYDMCGNVNEWCADWYSLYPETPQTNPTGPETGRSRIYRGGSWQNASKACRITRRNYFAPGTIRNYMGFRLAM